MQIISVLFWPLTQILQINSIKVLMYRFSVGQIIRRSVGLELGTGGGESGAVTGLHWGAIVAIALFQDISVAVNFQFLALNISLLIERPYGV